MNDQQIKKRFSKEFVLLCDMALRHASSRRPNIEGRVLGIFLQMLRIID